MRLNAGEERNPHRLTHRSLRLTLRRRRLKHSRSHPRVSKVATTEPSCMHNPVTLGFARDEGDRTILAPLLLGRDYCNPDAGSPSCQSTLCSKGLYSSSRVATQTGIWKTFPHDTTVHQRLHLLLKEWLHSHGAQSGQFRTL